MLRPRRQTHAESWAQMEAAIKAFKGIDFVQRDRTPPRDDIEPFD